MGSSSVNSHLLRCRGEEWGLHFFAHNPSWIFTNWYGDGRVTWWTATPKNESDWLEFRRDRPAWLPVAWLCCEADPADGPRFAAAILDAGAGDDAPALIACDWLERLGAQGAVVEWSESPTVGIQGLHDVPGEWAPDIEAALALKRGKPISYSAWAFSGPLACWCRHLIATRCVACGGWRDGEDRIKIENGMLPRRVKARELEGCPVNCPLCGFPAHPTPPALAIPGVVK